MCEDFIRGNDYERNGETSARLGDLPMGCNVGLTQGKARGQGSGREHPRLSCSLWKVQRGWQAVLKPKSAVRSLVSFRNRLALVPCLDQSLAGAASGRHGISANTTMDFGAQ